MQGQCALLCRLRKLRCVSSASFKDGQLRLESAGVLLKDALEPLLVVGDHSVRTLEALVEVLRVRVEVRLQRCHPGVHCTRGRLGLFVGLLRTLLDEHLHPPRFHGRRRAGARL